MGRIQVMLRVLAPALALLAIGCSAGDTPIETVKVEQHAQTQQGAAEGSSMEGAIQGNPNMPQAAKDALLGKGKGK